MAPKKRKATKEAAAAEPKEKKQKEEDALPVVSIEACKSWGAFKTRANKLVKALAGEADVVVNAEKPRKGAFVVSVGDAAVLELLDMKRPFPALKALDMDDVAKDVKAALAE